jgi:hypothetical protein
VTTKIRNSLVSITLVSVVALTASLATAAEPPQTSGEKVALQATSWLLTIPYGALKVAYALGGGIVGGLAWLATGGSSETAKAIWIPSVAGDYIIQPQNLTGEKSLHFIGP